MATHQVRSRFALGTALVMLILAWTPTARAQEVNAEAVALTTTNETSEQSPSTRIAGRRSWQYGVRGGLYSNGGRGFLGGGTVFPVSQRFAFNPNAEWLFDDTIDRMFMINADLHYDLPIDGRALSWVGAGIGVRHFAKGDGWPPEHSLGLNLVGGMGLAQENGLVPFVQAKVFLAGDTLFANGTEFVMTAGLRF